MPFPSEMYFEDMYRVVHGPEEQSEFGAAGWKDQKDPNIKQYRASTTPPPEAPADDPDAEPAAPAAKPLTAAQAKAKAKADAEAKKNG